MLTSGAMSFTGFRRTYLLQNKSDKRVLILSQHRLPVGVGEGSTGWQAPGFTDLQAQNESAVTHLTAQSFSELHCFAEWCPTASARNWGSPISDFLNTSQTYSPLFNSAVTTLSSYHHRLQLDQILRLLSYSPPVHSNLFKTNAPSWNPHVAPKLSERCPHSVPQLPLLCLSHPLHEPAPQRISVRGTATACLTCQSRVDASNHFYKPRNF